MSIDRSAACRCCESTDLHLVHDFGLQPLAGRYPTSVEDSERVNRYPLDLTQCLKCDLLQVTNLPPIEEVFNEEYCYSSSTIPDLKLHFLKYAEHLQSLIGRNARVFEFGCNDGVLLELLQTSGYSCAGLDASANVAAIARSKGLRVDTGFLTADYVRSKGLEGSFDVVTCSNVFAHIHDLRATMEAVRLLLAPKGLFCIEVHDGERLIEEAQFDTVYHEHLSYFTEQSLRRFLEDQGFGFVDCIRTPMHGGGLRMVSRLGCESVGGALRGERVRPLPDFLRSKIRECKESIGVLHSSFGELDGYGAAGRSQMFINITATENSFSQVFDDSKFRQDRFIAGTKVPVRPFAAGVLSDCCVILAWNYAATISAKVRGNYRRVVTILPSARDW